MGTIRKRSWPSGDGYKSAWVVDYVDQHGKRRLKTFAKRKGADDFIVKARHEVAQGTHTPDSASITVADACKLWLERAEAAGLEAHTLRTYRLTALHHVLPMLGREKLAKLSAPRVQKFADDLLRGDTPDGKPRGREMAGKALRALKAMVDAAQRYGLVAQNVATTARLPHGARHREHVVVPAKEHVRSLIEASTARWRPLVITAAFTGLRASELRGLTWADVDLDEAVLVVRQRADRYQHLGSPKTRSSRRSVPLMPIVANTLRAWKLACPISALALVFPTAKGTVHRHTNLAEHGFKAPQRRAGLVDEDGRPLYSVHALRHFAASLFIEQGFPPKRVQALMGHASITITFDRYGYLFPTPEDDRAKLAAAQLTVLGA
jgi:integrase